MENVEWDNGAFILRVHVLPKISWIHSWFFRKPVKKQI